jgi:hypothetical protein
MIAKLSSAVASCLAVAALYGMQHSTPYYSDIQSPVSIRGAQDKPTETSRFVFAVVNVHRARQLTLQSMGSTRTYTTDGEWLVIEAAAKAKSQSLTMSSAAWLGPNGVRYMLSDRLSLAPGMIDSERLEPGIPRPVLLVFEVPTDQIAGGSLLVEERAYAPLSEQVRTSMNSGAEDAVSSSIAINRVGDIMPWQLEVSP